MSDGKTHADGCWKWDRTHYACALMRIQDLEAALRGLCDLCEKAGMPCDRASALLAPQRGIDHE